MRELDHKEGWVLKNWFFWTVVLEKTLESPLDSKEIKPINPKRNQPWIFIGRTDVETEAPILWPPDVKSWRIGKDPEAGKDWGQEEKRGSKGWDGGVVSPTQWTWIWANSRRHWRTEEPGVLQSMGSQRVGPDWVTELNPTELSFKKYARWFCPLVKSQNYCLWFAIIWITLEHQQLGTSPRPS